MYKAFLASLLVGLGCFLPQWSSAGTINYPVDVVYGFGDFYILPNGESPAEFLRFINSSVPLGPTIDGLIGRLRQDPDLDLVLPQIATVSDETFLSATQPSIDAKAAFVQDFLNPFIATHPGEVRDFGAQPDGEYVFPLDQPSGDTLLVDVKLYRHYLAVLQPAAAAVPLPPAWQMIGIGCMAWSAVAWHARRGRRTNLLPIRRAAARSTR